MFGMGLDEILAQCKPVPIVDEYLRVLVSNSILSESLT